MTNRFSRRSFLGATAAVALAPSFLRAAERKESPNEKLHVGVIGVAGQGQYNWSELAGTGMVEVVALCDVHETRIGPAREKFPKASFDIDFRKMLDRKGLDAALVATPDHTHAVCTIRALQAGLHVYCEKPLTHTVSEARQVAETAKKTKRVTQMGTQIHAGNNYRRVVELIQSGAIGEVKEVHTWCGKSWGGGDRPKDMPPVPRGLHWDRWLGPAPERPYHPAYVPFNWRGWWDFGGGTLADMACHHMDLPFWALGLRYPSRVSTEGPPPHAETAAKWLIVTYEFPARGKLPPVTLKWYDGGKRPPHFAEQNLPKWGDGNLFVGAKGMLLAGYGNHVLLPEKEFKGFTPPKPTIPNSIGHHKEWVMACKNGGSTTCNFDYAGALTETVLLGNVSYRCGQPLEWDHEKLRAKNAPEADKFLKREYRTGWEK